MLRPTYTHPIMLANAVHLDLGGMLYAHFRKGL